jgi:hypothetical protein
MENKKNERISTKERISVTSEEFVEERHATHLLELEDDLSGYPHCRLPTHYFDRMLSRNLFGQIDQGHSDSIKNLSR